MKKDVTIHEVMDVVKKRALKLGEQTRTVVLMEINHDGSTQVNFFFGNKLDSLFVREAAEEIKTHVVGNLVGL